MPWAFSGYRRPQGGSHGTGATMALDALPAVDISSAAHDTVSSITLAASANDFGGYTFPVVGLLLLVGVIVSLSPPLAD